MGSLRQFRRFVNLADRAQGRIDRGELGRNAGATYSARDYNVMMAAKILSSACRRIDDPLPEYLDSERGRHLADKWNRLERAAAGLPV